MSKDLFHVLVTTSFVMPMKPADFIPEKARVWDVADRIEDAIRRIVREFELESECCNTSIGTIDGGIRSAVAPTMLQRKASSACSNANGSIGANTGIVLKRGPISSTTSSGSTILENDEGWKCLKRRIYS
jgi:hypothetical protein